MKKILLIIITIVLISLPLQTRAQIDIDQGGTGTTTFQLGTILFGGTSNLTSSISLFWDNTLKRLGIGTSSPAWKLSVAGNASFDDYVRSSFFTATSTTATSTLPITSINRISANTSAGVDVDSLTGSHVANFGVGSSQNSLFYGGVNIDGSTRLATSLTGPLQAISGAVTATSTLSTFYGGTGLNAVGASSTVLTTDGTVNKYNKLSAGNFITANISQWTNDSGYLTSLSGAASSTLLANNNTFSGNNTFSNTITGSITGNAGTATALAANGTNCSAGSYPLGVDASGNSENCTVAGGASLSGGSPNTLTYWTSDTTVGATSSPTIGYLTATSTATSTFSGTLHSAKATGNLLMLQNTSGTTADISFGISGSFPAPKLAGISAIRTNRAVSGDTDLAFYGYTNGVLGEKLRIRDDGNLGLGTTSPYAKLSVVGQIVGEYFTATSTATSTFAGGINVTSGCLAVNGTCVTGTGSSYSNADTNAYIHASTTIPKTYTANTFTGLQTFSNTGTTTFAGGIQTTALNVTSTTASSTFANGINITGGCFAISGTCFSGGGSYGDSNVNSYIHSSSTIPKTYTANTFSALQTIPYASTTMITATTASSTQFIAGFGDVSNPAYTFSGSTNNGIYLVSAGNVSIATAGNRVFNFNNSFNTSYRDLFGNTSKTFKLEADAGSATTPTYSFDTDGNTGIWSSGADSLNLTTGGTDRLTIDSSGLVTLGNASTTALSANTLCISTDCRTAWPSGTSNYLTNSGSNTYLNTGTNLQAPTINATSTTATSTIQNALGIGTSTPASSFDIYGSFSGKVSTISATTTLDIGYFTVVADTSSNQVQVNLPSATSSCGRIYNISKSNAGGNKLIIKTNGTNTLNGTTTQYITSQYTNYQVQSLCSSGSWLILSNNF